MEPSKGRIVNYHCLEGERHLGGDEDRVLPAIITRVYPGSVMKAVDLIVFTNNPSGPIAMRMSVAYGMTNGGGWTWPSIKRETMEIDATAKVPVKPVGQIKVGVG